MTSCDPDEPCIHDPSVATWGEPPPRWEHGRVTTPPSPSHHVGLAIMRGPTFLGVTSVGFDVGTEPTNSADVDALGRRITARAREAGDLPSDMSYFVLSWQPFGTTR